MIYENEITVKINSSKEELIKYLIDNNYKKIDEYTVSDIYYVKNETDLNDKFINIIKDTILIRKINEDNLNLVYKYKEFDDNENIIKQGKVKLGINDIESAKDFLEIIGYKKLINVFDEIIVFEKDGLEINIEYVNDKYLFVEIEESEKYNTVDKLIEALNNTNIDYDKSNYFVKKAKIIFEENFN